MLPASGRPATRGHFDVGPFTPPYFWSRFAWEGKRVMDTGAGALGHTSLSFDPPTSHSF